MKPIQVVKPISKTLDQLEDKLLEINAMPNKVEAIVKLFQVVSPLQDAGGFSQALGSMRKTKDAECISALEALEKHIDNAGRYEFGINRTKAGEEVTPDKVFLGNIHGLFTKSAEYFLKNREALEKEDSFLTPKPGCGLEFISVWYVINDYQAANFVASHVVGMMANIAILKKQISLN